MSSLAGVSVVVTRDDPALAAALGRLGADVSVVPLVVVEPLDDASALRGVDLAGYDWLMLTSVNGVAAVAEHIGTPPARVRIGVVGAATARAAEAAFDRPVDFVPRYQRAVGMLAEFTEPSARIVAVHADAAAPTLVDGLRAAGHTVDAVVGYHTVERRPTPAERARLRAGDVIVVASGSAVRSLVAADTAGPATDTANADGPATHAATAGPTTGAAASGATADGAGAATDAGGDACDRRRPLVAIGPSTAAVARQHGFTHVVTAADPSTAALTAAVVAAVTRQPSAGRPSPRRERGGGGGTAS